MADLLVSQPNTSGDFSHIVKTPIDLPDRSKGRLAFTLDNVLTAEVLTASPHSSNELELICSCH